MLVHFFHFYLSLLLEIFESLYQFGQVLLLSDSLIKLSVCKTLRNAVSDMKGAIEKDMFLYLG